MARRTSWRSVLTRPPRRRPRHRRSGFGAFFARVRLGFGGLLCGRLVDRRVGAGASSAVDLGGGLLLDPPRRPAPRRPARSATGSSAAGSSTTVAGSGAFFFGFARGFGLRLASTASTSAGSPAIRSQTTRSTSTARAATTSTVSSSDDRQHVDARGCGTTGPGRRRGRPRRAAGADRHPVGGLAQVLHRALGGGGVPVHGIAIRASDPRSACARSAARNAWAPHLAVDLAAVRARVGPKTTPPPVHWGARIEPWRARPVPFWRHGFAPPPRTSPRVFVEWVPARRAASSATTVSWMSVRLIGWPAIASASRRADRRARRDREREAGFTSAASRSRCR